MRPVPTVSQRQYATASAHETPSSVRSAARRFRSHSSGGGCCVSSTNSAYSPTRTGRRAMAKTFTCSVRGGSPSSASPAGTTKIGRASCRERGEKEGEGGGGRDARQWTVGHDHTRAKERE